MGCGASSQPSTANAGSTPTAGSKPPGLDQTSAASSPPAAQPAQPAAGSAAEKPSADKPSADQPPAGKPAADKPQSAETGPVDAPVANEPPSEEKPAVEAPPAEDVPPAEGVPPAENVPPAEDLPVELAAEKPVGEVPTGAVFIMSGFWEQEYLVQSANDDGEGRRSISTALKTEDADLQLSWTTTALEGGRYTITDSSGFYLYAAQLDDGEGRRYIHTWINGGAAEEDPQGIWLINPHPAKPGTFTLRPSNVGEGKEYMYVYSGEGDHRIFSWMSGGDASEDQQADWIIVAQE
mmetsp:Transcript_75310/g.145625  ORF Transcript_75310/g.145625 Transcript_75310/m.145625 type:complete len:294 (-) Transcript_75310:39-920(-)|eukprot:CAMPEP_0172837972 /NCGR_PEP_ID=MMETSP1075-20121228/27555_1 /TAXON_ID=2916 /ORGANISM="Ceratium fusus, Strain PA161109" /LENGTH=293 /DNA_ID=CAMNT_0013681425 /DNA_START=79 /DNA_END=960 /DNA_ORIENTATION=-